LIAEYISKRGYIVSFVTKNETSTAPTEETINGIRIYKTFSDDDGIPVLRFIYPKFIRLWKALSNSDSDFYYKRGPRYSAIVAIYCIIKRRKFIYSGANDWNFLNEFNFEKNIANTILNYFDKWGIKRADYVFVQSKTQQRLLKKNLGKDGIVFNNIYGKKSITKDQKFILWVANLKPQKRPHEFLEIARSLPDLEFKMIGGIVKGHENFYDELKRAAEEINNLQFLGFKSFEDTEKVFEGTSVFVNTSPQHAEGFPNTFLQSWARGIPTISFFDIDEIIKTNRLGIIIRNREEGSKAVAKLVNIEQTERLNIQSYFEKNHLPEAYLKKLNDVLTL